MSSRKAPGDNVTGRARRRRRWSGERLLFLVVGIVLCGYAIASFLLSR